MKGSEKPRILGRFILLSGLGVLGAISFVPSILASTDPHPPMAQLSLFVLAVSAVCVASSWFGLRFADATHLPMPYLRRLDLCSEPEGGNGFLPAAGFGCVFAAGAILVLHYFHQPNLPGQLWSRVASVFFAAGSLEIVVHLLIMSMVVRLVRGRIWVGILVAAIFFVVFHAAGLSGQSTALVASSVLLNGIFGLGLGLLYARYGFESVVLCHAIGHILAVSLA
jgi:Type II CAAX prenyl endopeptidase Rce1-like